MAIARKDYLKIYFAVLSDQKYTMNFILYLLAIIEIFVGQIGGISYQISYQSFDPADIPEDTTSVQFINFDLGTIPSYAFAHLTECTYMRFSSTQVREVEPNAWYGLNKLDDLRFRSNFLTTLDENTFKHLSSLTTLYLDGNRINAISSDAFSGFSSLKNLYLNDNFLSTVAPDTWKELSSLTKLDLHQNLLTVLETDTFQHLPSLQRLYLNNNVINTTELGCWDALSSLKELYLQENKISILRTNMFKNLSSLEKLDISDNMITHVEKVAFATLVNLRYLYLLTYLDLSGNELTILHENMFHHLTLLQQLRLHNNKIFTVEPNAFNGLTSLSSLWLYANLLETFKSDVFFPTDVYVNASLSLRLFGNKLICDKRMQWIKEGQEQGWLIAIVGECVNFPDTEWDHIVLPPNPTDVCLSRGCSECEETSDSAMYNCSCNEGLTAAGLPCDDMDECAGNSFSCSVCKNNQGAITCLCNPGFRSDRSECVNINECDKATNNCSKNANCQDTEGSYKCSCDSGFTGDGFSCSNINECENVIFLHDYDDFDDYSDYFDFGCSDDSTCIDTPGSYYCTCNAGFHGNEKTCTNIDECNEGTHNCSDNANCTDTEGSYECTCIPGFTGNGFNCSNINECENIIFSDYHYDYSPAIYVACPSGSTCIDTHGSYNCTCNPGFRRDGRYCTNIDECRNGTHNCSDNANCQDTKGSFSCSCDPGFTGDGFNCSNINECENSNHFYDYHYYYCSDDSTCTDTHGSFYCTCNAGFSGDGKTCTNIDECWDGSFNCSSNATCIDTEGSYNCTCNPGFSGDGFNCSNINECENVTFSDYYYNYDEDVCPYNSFCNDTEGSYLCICNSGFRKSAFGNCYDIDECTDGSYNCPDNADCINTDGSYNCTCKAGFTRDLNSCVDIDECQMDLCPEDADCINTVGSYQCKLPLRCPAGSYLADGINCQECPFNTYNAIPNNVQTECHPCPSGHETERKGSTSVSECQLPQRCPAGSYLANGINCTQCPQNTYNGNDNNAQTECFSCPKGYETKRPGSISVSQCILSVTCSPGRFIDATRGCTECRDGTYQPRASQIFCRNCPDNKVTTGGPGAASVTNCVPTELTRQESFKLKLMNETLDPSLEDKTSEAFTAKSNFIISTLEDALAGTRYFSELTVSSFSEGSVVTNMEATFLSHPDAEDIFFARLNSLDLNSLFSGGPDLEIPPESLSEIVSFNITSIDPNYGPKAGGTLIVLRGENLQLHGAFEIYIGTLRCPQVHFEDNEVVCLTLPMSDDAQLNKPQAVKISWTNNGVPDEDTGWTFTYKPDPVIEDIYPNVTITNGGIHITVNGQNLDTVKEPIMVVVVNIDGEVSTFYQPCEVTSSEEFICPTPDLTEILPDNNPQPSHPGSCKFPKKSHDQLQNRIQNARPGVNPEDIDVTIQFLQDGADSNKTLTPQVVKPPDIETRPDAVPFIPQPLCNDEFIYIKGDNLLKDFDASVYTVRIGDKECTELQVTDTSISCKPPQSEPDDHSEVQVIIGTCYTHIAFTLEYGGPFQCKPIVYITAGCAAAVLLIVLMIVVCYKCKRYLSKRRTDQTADGRTGVPGRSEEPERIDTQIRSVYPGVPDSYFPSYVSMATAPTEHYNYPTEPYSYPESVYGFSASMTAHYDVDVAVAGYSGSGGYQQDTPEYAMRQPPSTSHSYNNLNPDDNANRQVLRNKRRDNSELQYDPDARNKRLSNRYYPGRVHREMNYPDARNAPSQRVSQWFSSAETGMKKFRSFVNYR